MKSFLVICLYIYSFNTFAENASGSRITRAADDDPISSSEALKRVINNGNIYKIEKANQRCPSIIQMRKNDDGASSQKKESGDIPFRANGFEKKDGHISYGYFTHENDSFIFRPSITEGKSKTLERDCEFVLGVACRFNYQTTMKDYILFEGSAKILSIGMIGSNNVEFKFDSAANKISYLFKGNGIDDVVCNYGFAPNLSKEIKDFLAEQEAARAAISNRNADNSNRGAVKEKQQPMTESDGISSNAVSR